MNDHFDIGRPLVSADIVCSETSPIDERDSGTVFCYQCIDGAFIIPVETQALTSQTGVLTGRYRCDEGAPTWCCLSCAYGLEPMFSPEITELIRRDRYGE